MTAHSFKKFFAILLSLLVLTVTSLSILAIWDVISIERIFQKSFTSLFVIFAASAIILFIFTVLYPVSFKNNDRNHCQNTPPQQ
jgi:hypothetical protein